MKDTIVKDITLLQQMKERLCPDCLASDCYCRNCTITVFAKNIQKDLDKEKKDNNKYSFYLREEIIR